MLNQIQVWPGHPWALIPTALIPPGVQIKGARPAPSIPGLNGTPAILVPHTVDTHRALVGLGGRLPAPIINTYNWNRSTPFQSQRVTAAFLTLNKRAFVLSQMGVGKTRAALYAIDWLLKTGRISRAIIAAPLSTLTCVWEREISFWFPEINPVILHGSRKKRISLLQQPDWNVAIVNHDGLKVMLEFLKRGRANTQLFLIDELAVFRNQRTDTWRAGRQIADAHEFVWGMTGSPTPNSPTDAWAQVRLIDPTKATMTFAGFRDRVALKISLFKWEPRPGSQQTVYNLMQPAIRYTRAEVKELPPTIEVDRTVSLSQLQARLYDRMKEHLIVLHQQGQVTAVNAGVLIYKLAQIAGGVVYDDTGGAIEIGAPDRLKVTLETLNEADGKVIIFAGFRHTLRLIQAAVAKAGFTYEMVHGDIPQSARNRIFTDFQTSTDPRILIAHPRTMAHGLTLTAASTMIWFTPYPGRETYEQACARITRIGQTKPAVIVRLIGSPIEREMYRILAKRGSWQQSCLDLFENGLDLV
jgi:SNF2 family DNA or RNA helicase